MFENIKTKLATTKAKVAVAGTTAAMVAVSAVPTYAESTSTDYGTTISNAMSTAVSNIVDNTVSMVGTLLPTALTILGIFLTLRMGIKVVKSASKG